MCSKMLVWAYDVATHTRLSVMMSSKSVRLAWVLVGLVILQGAAAEVAQSAANTTGLISALESNGFEELAGLFSAIRLRDRDIPANLNVTVLAPTDQAITNFAASMGLNYEELRSRPGLVDTLLSYHVIPRKLTGEGLQAGGTTRVAKPLSAMSNPNDVLRFQRLANGTITVTDVQNNTARVASQPMLLPRANVFPVDRVLLNGDVFNNVTTMLQFHPEFSSLAALVTQVPGLAGTFRTNTFNYTLLAPTNDALSAASASVPTDTEGLARVLRYHVIARPGTLPDIITEGAPLMTLLPGHDVIVRYKRVVVPARFNSSRNVSFTTATVEPEPGSPGAPANVTSINLFAGKGTVHGINRVLLPARAASNASEAAEAGTAAATNSTPSSGRRMLGVSRASSLMMMTPVVSAASLLADAAAVDRQASGRQLLGYGSGRSSKYGDSDNGCDPTLNDGCGVPGSQNSMMWQSLQDSSDALGSGAAVDAGEEF